jgi:AcrR family transcriptional regulator
MAEQLADKAVERRIGGRRAEYEAEMRRVIDTTFELIQRTGSLDPSMREILAAAGLSTQAFYRYFSSKDELMLVLLDEGRLRLVETLAKRMRAADCDPSERIRAWIEGVLAQAANPDAAARTRPWVLSEQRLTERFPAEQQVSVDNLVDLICEPVAALMKASDDEAPSEVALAATFVYRLTFSALRSHLVAETRPSTEETSALVTFCLRGLHKDEQEVQP